MMKQNNNEQLNKISDLALATTLSLYSPIQKIESTDNRRVVFGFDKSQKVDDLITSFWLGELRIEPQQFFNQLKIIKTRIYSLI